MARESSLSIYSAPEFESAVGGALDSCKILHSLDVAFRACQESVYSANSCSDWSDSSGHVGQHVGDVVADDAALRIFEESGIGVLSEESGMRGMSSDLIAVIDPVDGSANVAREIPFWCASVAVLDPLGPLAACVMSGTNGNLYWAARGVGAFLNGEKLVAKPPKPLSKSVVFVNGFPKSHLGWMQYRVLGSAALELCMVAVGNGEAFIDASPFGLAIWDYLGAVVLLKELGYVVGDISGANIYELSLTKRHHIVAARDQNSFDEIMEKLVRVL